MLPYSPENSLIISARDYITNQYSKLYNGWDNVFDEEYDGQITWFVVIGSNEQGICAVGRFIIWNKDNANHKPLPFNFGNEFKWSSPDSPRIQIEGSGLAYEKKEDLNLLLYEMFKWLHEKDFEDCYALQDIENTAIANLHKNVLQFKHIDGAFVSFENFQYKQDNKESEPVKWQVNSQTRDARKKCLDILSGKINKVADPISYETIKYENVIQIKLANR